MRFSTIFTVLTAGAMAFAGAVPEIIAKRSNADIQKAFTDLSKKCDTIIPKFDNCYDDKCSDTIAVELIVAIDACTSTLGGLTGGLGSSAVANVVAEVTTVSVGELLGLNLAYALFQKIAVGLDTHKKKCGSGCPGLGLIYAKVDLSLSLCLKAVLNLCLGLLVLLTAL